PSRWLDASSNHHRAHEIRGYRHMLTFPDGPRMCLRKGFALAEFKVWASPPQFNYYRPAREVCPLA
ncbi:hypothetical protein FB451DRAFT_1054103, partial [Mycena latifolia]